uniref:PH domain-containing protein n=2 Tax=Ditylum brightwellii TaxID=49249 RepID=A0A7S4S2F4_9STRA
MTTSTIRTHSLKHESISNMSKLLVDEIEFMSPMAMAPSEPYTIKGFAHSHRGMFDNLGSRKVGTMACPCCQRYVDGRSIGEECGNSHWQQQSNRGLGSSFSEVENGRDNDERSRIIDYEIKEELYNGWVYKKGTGRDWFSCRDWKPRYATLVLANVPGYEADVPLLLIYWHSQVPTPTTVIILDSTIIMAVDRNEGEVREEQPESSNTHCFDVVNTRASSGKQKKDTMVRTFAAPLKERNEWVVAMRDALKRYGRRKVMAGQSGRTRTSGLPPTSPPRRRTSDTVGRSIATPPVSPHQVKRSITPQRIRRYIN